jgi:hypothetical protein
LFLVDFSSKSSNLNHMKIPAKITVARKELPFLYEWLNNHASDWVLVGNDAETGLTPEQSREIIARNLSWLASHMVSDRGFGEKKTKLQALLPNEQSAMLAKLAWIDIQLGKVP